MERNHIENNYADQLHVDGSCVGVNWNTNSGADKDCKNQDIKSENTSLLVVEILAISYIVLQKRIYVELELKQY